MEWILLEALRQCCDREQGRSTYLRLSTKPIDQTLFTPALERLGADELQRQVLAGGYRLVDWRNTDPVVPRERLVHIATTGVMIPEAIEAANILREHRIAVNVLNMTSPRRLFEAWQTMQQLSGHLHSGGDVPTPFDWLIPTNERYAPIVTVHDGASHALSWLGSVYGELTIPLGVDEFGQSGDRSELYRHFGIDAEGIATAGVSCVEPLWSIPLTLLYRQRHGVGLKRCQAPVGIQQEI